MKLLRHTFQHALLAGAVVFAGCDSTEAAPDGDEENSSALAGKADQAFDPCHQDGILLLVNDITTTVDALKTGGVNTRAAKRIVAARDGDDGVAGTEDDVLFTDLEAVDKVPWVGSRSFEQLEGMVRDRCASLTGYPDARVIFSPQAWDTSHVAAAEALIDGAEQSVDVAMYSFRVTSIREALGRAIRRGVKVRFIFESANGDHKDPAGTSSAALEDEGVDVRYINKIMHHKFVLVDGPQTRLMDAVSARLLTGSANLSSSAATRYDENTTVVSGSPELALRFQQEFNHMWENSRDFIWDDTFAPETTMTIADAAIPDDQGVDVSFTSANFQIKWSNTYGPTFSVVRGRNEIADAIVALVDSAQDTIKVASGHLRSRPVAEALEAAIVRGVRVQIYLDGQEFISAGTHQYQLDALAECLVAAGTSEAKQQDCQDKGFYYSYPLHLAGAELRFKHYSYRWHYSYAEQMHHKYIIVDDTIVASGSYNLSDNAEHNTLENMVFYDAARYGTLVADFITNFGVIWQTGEAEGHYLSLLDTITNGTGDVPMVYPSMALTWDEVSSLKQLIRDTCTDEDDEDHRRSPESHRTCSRK